jgi:hypothetical protein
MRNAEYFDKMKAMMDKFSAEMLGDIMATTGVRLCELDEDQVKLWNKCIKFYNETFNLARDMAKDMDETQERQEREINELRQELIDTRRNTEMIIRMLEADKKKKSSSATTE